MNEAVKTLCERGQQKYPVELFDAEAVIRGDGIKVNVNINQSLGNSFYFGNFKLKTIGNFTTTRRKSRVGHKMVLEQVLVPKSFHLRVDTKDGILILEELSD